MTISLTIAQAVKASGIGRTKLYALIKEGRLKPRKCGKRTLILMADLEAFVQSLPEAR